MGCCKSKDKRTSNVDQYLKDEKIKSLTNFKVLLLGAGESGKSTVIKQLKIIHNIQMDEAEIKHYIYTLHSNTLTSMQAYLEAAKTFGYYDQLDAESKGLAEKVLSFEFEDVKLIGTEQAEAISKLWKNEVIQKVHIRRNEFWNLEAAPFYFDNVLRFVEDGYRPNEEDCILARVRTTGIVVTEFDDGEVHFKVVDVAGQRSERKKWIHCFDDVKCLVFVVNLAGYDAVLFEDPSSNRMNESLNLFQQIVNNPYFEGIPIFLFLNKKDLFEKMILDGTSLNKCFPEYTGGNDAKEALHFITEEFKKRVNDENKKRLHIEYIAARFRKDVKYAFDEMKKVLIENNIKDVKEARKGRKKIESRDSKLSNND